MRQEAGWMIVLTFGAAAGAARWCAPPSVRSSGRGTAFYVHVRGGHGSIHAERRRRHPKKHGASAAIPRREWSAAKAGALVERHGPYRGLIRAAKGLPEGCAGARRRRGDARTGPPRGRAADAVAHVRHSKRDRHRRPRALQHPSRPPGAAASAPGAVARPRGVARMRRTPTDVTPPRAHPCTFHDAPARGRARRRRHFRLRVDSLTFSPRLPLGVTGNTPDSGSGKSRFEPWRGNYVRKARAAAITPRPGLLFYLSRLARHTAWGASHASVRRRRPG